mgnify:CR=1 FL=1
MDSVYFRAWVANTVYAISGMWAFDWRGSQRTCALTTAEIRAAACQEVFERKLHSMNSMLARHGRLATTHKRVLH